MYAFSLYFVIEPQAHEFVHQPVKKTVTFSGTRFAASYHKRDPCDPEPTDNSEIQGNVSSTTIPYDYLVFAVGAEVQTFGIPGVKEHACFMKEIGDAEKARKRPYPPGAFADDGGFVRCKDGSWIVSLSISRRCDLTPFLHRHRIRRFPWPI